MTIFSENLIDQIKELIERVAHIVKTRFKFYSFKEFLQ